MNKSIDYCTQRPWSVREGQSDCVNGFIRSCKDILNYLINGKRVSDMF